jgi:hypothetical protein
MVQTDTDDESRRTNTFPGTFDKNLRTLVIATACPTLLFVLIHRGSEYARHAGMGEPPLAVAVVLGIVYFVAAIAGPALTLVATIGGAVAIFRRTLTPFVKAALWVLIVASWAAVHFMTRNVRW